MGVEGVLVVRDPGAVPGEGWMYPGVVPGFYVRAPNYGLLYGEVVKHYGNNGVVAPSEQEVIEWVCRELHANCYDAETRVPLVNKLSLSLPIRAAGCCGK